MRHAGRDAIFTYDDITWEAAMRRGMCFPTDRLALALLDDPRVRRALVCDQPRSAPVKLAKDAVGRRGAFPTSDRARIYQPLRLRRRDPSRLAALERYYAAYGRRLRRAAGRAGLDQPVVITAHPFVAAFADLDWADSVTLFATDDWSAHPAYERWRSAYLAAYERIARRELRVCAVTETILERIDPRGPALVVPNGVDSGEWLVARPAPDWLAELPRPRFLYVGTLDSRLDGAAVAAIARDHPRGTVIIAGPVAEEKRVARLRQEPNVVLPGPVPRTEVAALARAADVCLVPHVRLPLTEAMSPLKIYEYLAAGRPVVATDLRPMRGIDPSVELVPPGGDFASAARSALARGPMSEDERHLFIDRNSWARRSAQVLDFAVAEASRPAEAASAAGRR